MTWNILNEHIVAIIYDKSGEISFSCNNITDIFHIKNIKFCKIIINELVTWPISFADNNKYKSMPSLLNFLKEFKEKNNTKFELCMHDYYCICPSYTLLDYNNKYCKIPKNLTKCSICLSKNTNLAIPNNFDINKWRTAWQELFNITDHTIFFSNESLSIVKKIFNLSINNTSVQPHQPLTNWNYTYKPPKCNTLIIGVLGNITFHKGGKIISDLLHILKNDERIIIIGECTYHIPKHEKLYIHGSYIQKEIPIILNHYGITIVFIPSIWPETFSYTTQEFMQLELPTVAFSLGAQAERLGKWKKGLLADKCTAESAYIALSSLNRKRIIGNF